MTSNGESKPKGSGVTIFEILMLVAILAVASVILFPRHESQQRINRDGSARERNSQVLAGPVDGGKIE